MSDKIDLVYLWVDGNDENWRDAKNKWLTKMGGVSLPKESTNAARWRDNNELMYSLRSVAKNIPWINHIWIITSFGQVPKWLNTAHPKITVVPDTDIFPQGALPTFNSNAIEMCIPNIPGLAEKFLLANDDTFVGRPLKPSFFFMSDGRARFLYRPQNVPKIESDTWMDASTPYVRSLIYSAKLLQDAFGCEMYQYRPSHGIDPYFKSTYQQLSAHPKIGDCISQTVHNRFRNKTDVQHFIFNLNDLRSGRAKFIRTYPAKKYTRHKIRAWLYNTLHYFETRQSPLYCSDVKNACTALRRAPIFCINDEPDTTDEMRRRNAEYLHARFPDKCEFEK